MEGHKYSLKRVKTETEELNHRGHNVIASENGDGTIVFTNAWGKGWSSTPMTVEEAKFFLWGFRQAKEPKR